MIAVIVAKSTNGRARLTAERTYVQRLSTQTDRHTDKQTHYRILAYTSLAHAHENGQIKLKLPPHFPGILCVSVYIIVLGRGLGLSEHYGMSLNNRTTATGTGEREKR